jgi:hypothetical protein
MPASKPLIEVWSTVLLGGSKIIDTGSPKIAN